MKKIMIAILMFTVALLMLSIAQADTISNPKLYYADNFEYSYYVNKDGTATIFRVGFVTNDKKEFSFPSHIQGYEITQISGDGEYGELFKNDSVFTCHPSKEQTGKTIYYQLRDYLHTVKIPDTVHTIGDYAFYYVPDAQFELPWSNINHIGICAFYRNKKLSTIDNLESLSYLGSQAFRGCPNLKSIKLPDSLAFIGDNPFVECSALTVIEISKNHPLLAYNSGVLFDKPSKRLVTYLPRLSAEEYIVLDGIKEIGAYAFYSCKNLNNVQLPETLTTIGEMAFAESPISQLTIPASVTDIGEDAFPSRCVLKVTSGSYAHTYAIENNYAYEISDGDSDMSWLN